MRNAVVAGVLAIGASAFAGPTPDDSARAAKLFEQGRDQLKRGELEAGCTSFADSFALDPADGTELNLADCQERLGHLADAWRLFEQTAILSASKNNTARSNVARERAARLLPKLGEVVVTLPDADAVGLIVEIAGASVPPGRQIRRKVDPGKIAIRASEPDHVAFETTVSVEAGATVPVTIAALAAESGTEINKLPDRPVDKPTPSTAGVHGVSPTPPLSPDRSVRTQHRRRGRVLAGEIIGGIGVLGLGVAGGLAWKAHGDYDNAVAGTCSKATGYAGCTAGQRSRANSAVRLADIATITGSIGLALAIAGGVLWYTAPIEVSVTPSSASVAIAGHF